MADANQALIDALNNLAQRLNAAGARGARGAGDAGDAGGAGGGVDDETDRLAEYERFREMHNHYYGVIGAMLAASTFVLTEEYINCETVSLFLTVNFLLLTCLVCVLVTCFINTLYHKDVINCPCWHLFLHVLMFCAVIVLCIGTVFWSIKLVQIRCNLHEF